MSSTPFSPPHEPDYAWEVATLFPAQGDWSEEAYLELTDGTNKLIEFTDGKLEFLPMATEIHQALIEFLFLALRNFVEQRGLGQVRFTGLRVRVRPDKIRQPDVLFLHKDRFHLRHNRVWDGADLVMEVVSDDAKDRQRDYKEKVADYAEGNIAEYWIVDPQRRQVVVHALRDGRYEVRGEFNAGEQATAALAVRPERLVRGEFNAGEQATSAVLPGFAIDVTSLFAEMDDIPK